MNVYQPVEDSYLLAKTLNFFLKSKEKSIKILDLGSGSGIQAEICRKQGFKDILTSDINEEAIKCLIKKKFKSIKSNLFEKIQGKFDLILFNPPYLPEDKREPLGSKISTTGGKKGYELILKFLEQSKNHLNDSGQIIFLISSLTHPKIIIKKAKDLGYEIQQMNKKELFFESLFVYICCKKSINNIDKRP